MTLHYDTNLQLKKYFYYPFSKECCIKNIRLPYLLFAISFLIIIAFFVTFPKFYDRLLLTVCVVFGLNNHRSLLQNIYIVILLAIIFYCKVIVSTLMFDRKH